MITNLLLFVSFFAASVMLGQAATRAGERQRRAIRVKVEAARRR